jgi:drug/metabolite transporter (DMT)-like permease
LAKFIERVKRIASRIQPFQIGVIMAIITVIAISTQPIISESRPDVLYAVFYALTTVLFENILILPIALTQTISREKKTSGTLKKAIKEHWWRLLIVGLVFSIAQITFFWGFDISGDSAAVSGSIALKSSIIFTLIIGWIFLKEKASIIQLIFTGIIFVGLFYTLTLGTFRPEKVNFGTLILFLTPLFWTVGHSLSKKPLQKGDITPSQLIYTRTLISTVILTIFTFTTNPLQDVTLFFNWTNLLFMFLIALTYAIGHIGWYISIKNIDLALSSAIQAPQPILTSFFAWWILKEPIEIYHYVGLAVIFLSILIILYDKQRLSKRFNAKTTKTI